MKYLWIIVFGVVAFNVEAQPDSTIVEGTPVMVVYELIDGIQQSPSLKVNKKSTLYFDLNPLMKVCEPSVRIVFEDEEIEVESRVTDKGSLAVTFTPTQSGRQAYKATLFSDCPENSFVKTSSGLMPMKGKRTFGSKLLSVEGE